MLWRSCGKKGIAVDGDGKSGLLGLAWKLRAVPPGRFVFQPSYPALKHRAISGLPSGAKICTASLHGLRGHGQRHRSHDDRTEFVSTAAGLLGINFFAGLPMES